MLRIGIEIGVRLFVFSENVIAIHDRRILGSHLPAAAR
jgi:hypothetical protein